MKRSLWVALTGLGLVACSADIGSESPDVASFQGRPPGPSSQNGSQGSTNTGNENATNNEDPGGSSSDGESSSNGAPADEGGVGGDGVDLAPSGDSSGSGSSNGSDTGANSGDDTAGSDPNGEGDLGDANGGPPADDGAPNGNPPVDDGSDIEPNDPLDDGNPTSDPPLDDGNNDNQPDEPVDDGNPPEPEIEDPAPPAPPPDLQFGTGPLANGLCAANTGLGSGSGGKDTAFAVLSDGSAVSVLGGTATDLAYEDGSPVNDAIAISNGGYASPAQFCFARVDGSMHCSAGNGAASNTAAHDSGVLALSTRDINGDVCALMDDFSVACGGSGGLTPTATGSGLPAIQLGCFRDNACCIVDQAGEIHCFGENATPTEGPDARAIMVAGMDLNQCAVYDNGESYCWGSGNFGGQTGGSPVQANPIVPVPIEGDLVSVAGGQFHACWLHTDGTVSCSGNGGGTGNGAGGGSDQPTKILDESGNVLSGIIAINAGRSMSCAAAGNGDLYCWGLAGGQGAVAVRIDLGGRQVRMPDDCRTQ